MREASEQEHGEERVDSTVKEGKFQGGEGGQVRRASLGNVEESLMGVDGEALQEDLQNHGFTPSLANLEMGKEVGRQRARS